MVLRVVPMINQQNRYLFSDIENISYNGFNFTIPPDTMAIISSLAIKVGSPAYIKTPDFQKRDQSQTQTTPVIRKRRTKELSNTEWETTKSTASVLVQKEGIDAHINQIRVYLNKLSEQTYQDILIQITDVLNTVISENANESELYKIGNAIFEIASNNKFFSKLYAILYTELMKKFQQLNEIFTKNYDAYLLLFKNIEYIDPDIDYNQFCVNNITNEKRKAVSSFFVNLTLNGVIPPENMINILKELFDTMLSLMVQHDKANEVCELIENISIIYNPKIMQMYEGVLPIVVNPTIGDKTFPQIITHLAGTKMKTYPSLSSKVIFKCMDI